MRRWFIAGLLAIVLAVVSVPVTNALIYTPGAAAARYLSAISDADASRALGMLARPPAGAPETLGALDDEVLAGAASLPSQVSIEATRAVDESRAVVTASFVLGQSTKTIELPMVRTGNYAAVWNRWLVDAPALPTLAVTVNGAPQAALNTRPVTTVAGPLPVLFPVEYSLGYDSQWLSAPDERIEVLGPESGQELSLDPTPTPELTTEVERQFEVFLTECAEAKTLAPPGCPFTFETNDEVLSDVAWQIDTSPPVRLEADGASYSVPVSVGQASMSAKLRDSVTAEVSDVTEEVPFFLGARVTIDGERVIVEPRQ